MFQIDALNYEMNYIVSYVNCLLAGFAFKHSKFRQSKLSRLQTSFSPSNHAPSPFHSTSP